MAAEVHGIPALVGCSAQRTGYCSTVKKILELLVCFLHPIAVLLVWLNLSTRGDLTGGQKLAWGIFALIPLVPFLYVLTGGDLW